VINDVKERGALETVTTASPDPELHEIVTGS
jgi:hypothetical protein